jgi:hypothetical protein
LLIIRLHGALLPLSSSSLPRTSRLRDDTGIYFDEVHDVPAAWPMLEPVMPAHMLNRCTRRVQGS